MKFLFAVFIICGCNAYSQSKYFIENKTNKPNTKDSLIIYDNAIKVDKFFENNKLYTKVSSHKIENKNEIFNLLQNARDVFFKIRNDVSPNNTNDPDYIKVNPGYTDITYKQYYKKIDEHRFFQRELENQIINATSPMPMYDSRICPYVINEYKCEDKSSIYFGDIVNIPMYIPVVVKPFSMLTDEEKKARVEILKKKNQTTSIAVSKNKATPVFADNGNNNRKGNAVFYFNNAGSGSIIGFMNCGVFRKVRKEEYKEFVVMKYAQDFLENEERFNKWLKIRYGSYCVYVR
jgi:hypothetical protein